MSWLLSTNSIGAVLIDVSADGNTIISTNPARISTDRGISWSDLSGAPSDCYTPAISGDSSVIYMQTWPSAKVYRKRSGGSWELILSTATCGSVFTTYSGNTVMVPTYSNSSGTKIYVSHDYGDTWTTLTVPVYGVGFVAASDDGKYIGALGDAFIYVSSDYGATWTQKVTNYGVQDIYPIRVSRNGQYFATGCREGRIFISSDYGSTWQMQNAPNFRSISMSYDGSIMAVTQNNGNVLVSNTYGSTWSLTQNLSNSWFSVAVAGFGSAIYASSGSGLYKYFTPSPPDAPTSVTAIPSNQKITLSWIAPVNTGGSAISNYSIYDDSNTLIGSTTSTSYTLSGLTNGTAYTYYIKATNSVGISTASNIITSIPVAGNFILSSAEDLIGKTLVICTTPIANNQWAQIMNFNDGGYPLNPTNGSKYMLFILNSGRTGGNLELTASTPPGEYFAGTTHYAALSQLIVTTFYFKSITETILNSYYYNGNLNSITINSNSKLIYQSNLLSGINNFILGKSSFPGNPFYDGIFSQVAIYNGDLSVNSPLIKLQALIQSPNQNTYTNSTYTFGGTGDMNGLTVLRFGSTNATETGITLSSIGSGYLTIHGVISTTINVPNTPTSLSAVANNQQLTLSWSAPTNNGGAAITGYTIYNATTNAALPLTISGTTATITGLTNGTSYSYYVKAANSAGTSPASSTITAVPLNLSGSTVDTSSLVVSNATQAGQIISGVSTATAPIVQQVASAAITQVASGSSVAAILTAGKNIAAAVSGSALKATVMAAAGAASVPKTASTASNKLSDYVARITSVIAATKADATVAPNLKDVVGGAAASVLNTVGETTALTIPAILIAANSETGATKADVKTGAVASVEASVSGSSVAVPAAEAPTLVASIPNKTATFETVAANGLNILVADKDTKIVMLPTNGSAWYVPMASGVTYTFKNSAGTNSAQFVYDATAGTLTKDGQAFTMGDSFTLNGWMYPNYAIGSVGGANGAPAPTPIEVNLNVEVSANGQIQILSESAPDVNNVVEAAVKLSAKCLYDEAASKGLIEFWEPTDVDDIVCQLAQSPTLGASGYEETAKELVLGLQDVLCGSLDASNAQPFSTTTYSASDRIMTGFGRLALMAYAHYLLGHVQATAAITNDKQFIQSMLSLQSSSDVANIQASDYKYATVEAYNPTTPAAPYTTVGTESDANLAARLVNTIITNNTGTSSVKTGAAGTLAHIVKQVLGQDANRAVNADNSKYTPERHGLLKFFKDDVIYVTITLNQPTVVVGNGQNVGGSVIEGRYSPSTNANKYTLKITLDN